MRRTARRSALMASRQNAFNPLVPWFGAPTWPTGRCLGFQRQRAYTLVPRHQTMGISCRVRGAASNTEPANARVRGIFRRVAPIMLHAQSGSSRCALFLSAVYHDNFGNHLFWLAYQTDPCSGR